MISDTVPERIIDLVSNVAPGGLELIAVGGEGTWVFDFGPEKVLKVYDTADRDRITTLADHHKTISNFGLPFAVPEVLEIDEHSEVWFAIERKLPGRPGVEVYQELDAKGKIRLFESLLEAASAIGEVALPQFKFGSLLRTDTPESDTWIDYLMPRIDQIVRGARWTLGKDVPDLDERIERFKYRLREEISWDSKRLVHEDLTLNNVLFDSSGKVASVLDFGGATCGDPRLDIAGALTFLTWPHPNTGLPTDAFDQCKALAIRMFGTEVVGAIDLYAVYYALFYSNYGHHAPEQYEWCLGYIRGF